ncbi:MAG: hypothetical protein LBV55_03670, partial [Acholeplasmatales bacterium]|jgi:hypothetical protein|nr:hypothetical protein [Acholeplasmatales bacterium]
MKKLLLLLLPIFAVVFASCKPKEEKIDVTKLNSVWDLVGYEYPGNSSTRDYRTRIIKGPAEKTFYVYLVGEEPTLDNLFIDEEDLIESGYNGLRFRNPIKTSISFTIHKNDGRYTWFEMTELPSMYRLIVRTKI